MGKPGGLKLFTSVAFLIGGTTFCLFSFLCTMTFLSLVVAERLPFGEKSAYEWILGVSQPQRGGDVVLGPPSHFPVNAILPYQGINLPVDFDCVSLLPTIDEYTTDSFGSPRPPYVRHTGIDFGTNYTNGHPVVTPWGGKVVYIGFYGSWGPTVIVENAGVQVVLSHASDIAPGVEVGSIVEAGEVIMYSGGCINPAWTGNGLNCPYSSNGSSSGAHLHFEVRDVSGLSGELSSSVFVVNPSSFVWPGGFVCDFEAIGNVSE